MKMNKTLLVSALAGIVTLSGCSSMTPIAAKTKAEVKQGEQEIKKTFDSGFDKVAPVKNNFKQSKSVYINPNPLPANISSKKALPKFFENKLEVTSPAALPVNEIINDIAREYADKYKKQLNVNIAQDVFNPDAQLGSIIEESGGGSTTSSSQPTINGLTSAQINGVLIDSFVFEGSLESALNQITQKAGISWEWNGSTIEIYRSKVKNFYVAALASQASGDAATATTSQIQEMKTYIRSMLNPTGKFSIMESSGIITVRDTPLVLDTVEKALKEFNSVISKQIHVNLEIYEVEMSEEDLAGLDWNIVWNKALANQAYNYSSLGAPSGINTFTMGVTNGPFSGTTLNAGLKAVNANILNTKSITVVTKNGKTVPVKSQDTTEYIKTVTRDTDENGNITYTPEIAEGTTGIDGKIQARVQPDGKILLKFSLKIEELKSLRNTTIGDITTQLADKSSKEFPEQEITLQSGNTLVMSGMKTSNKKQTAQGIGNPNFWLLGGQQAGNNKHTYLVVIATPYLVDVK